MKDLVKLAEEYCRMAHSEQKRKGGNQEDYSKHPFAVRDKCVEYGYNSIETQCIALLHDVIEDTHLKNQKDQIEKRFGTEIYRGVYVLSKNTVGKHFHTLIPIFHNLGIQLLGEKEQLSAQAYKVRLLFAPDSIKRIKISDMIDNTSSLPDLSKKGIERKIYDAKNFYIPLGHEIAPIMIKELIRNIETYERSDHHKGLFG